jgi:hypothetical protein
MIRRPEARRRWLAGAAVYAAVCLGLASFSWVAVGTVAAGGRSSPAAGSPGPSKASTAPESTWPDDWPVAMSTPDYDVTAAPKAVSTMTYFEMDVYRPNTFVSQVSKQTCMAAAMQNMLNIIGPKIDLSGQRQAEISTALIANTTKEDSHNGGYGPLGWAITMKQFGAGNYKLLIDNSLDQALSDAAVALRKTGRPVGLLTWWGAHSWVMTGFESYGDPRYFPKTFHVNGAYIVDPFYPRVSSIWGQTIGPDIFRDYYAMQHNYIGWKRPEGHYADRDGKWLLVVPY